MSETCKTCRFWGPPLDDNPHYAECRAHSPSLPITDVQIAAFLKGVGVPLLGISPYTHANKWCGEHQPIPAEPKNVTSTGDIRYA